MSQSAGAGQRSNLVFIDIVSLAVYFCIAAAVWPGAKVRDFEQLSCLGNPQAIAKFTKQANDYQQS
ncbi:hypothetical protein GJ699_15015 [Duganella sp. FT80W]|uniref:Uncharacterized protein n=1 Tax=Duganella guangzhouensis TaxID=2666084 RepID=A0A6I2L080_9BURK|nr:hypothetical protein [Duganella guangzhouensis]MRW91303.1 hypothetical protein [Duganella guangzhouensis]